MACDCLHGVIGAAKAIAGIDLASDELIQSRRERCRGCAHASRSNNPKYADNEGLTTLSRCYWCGCVIALKTRLAKEHCPLAKW